MLRDGKLSGSDVRAVGTGIRIAAETCTRGPLPSIKRLHYATSVEFLINALFADVNLVWPCALVCVRARVCVV